MKGHFTEDPFTPGLKPLMGIRTDKRAIFCVYATYEIQSFIYNDNYGSSCKLLSDTR